jgi:hemerythrin-like domain-containing protein
MIDLAGSSNLVRDRFLADHDELERLFTRLLSALEVNDADSVTELWNEFDRHLTRHLEAEERLLVPQLFASRPREARTILEEHRHIRSRLLEVAFGVDLHIVRLETARSFIEELRAHARHEDEALYRWADAYLAAAEQNKLVAALGSSRRTARIVLGKPTMQKTNSVVAVYATHTQAEEALGAFKNSNFDMKQLSIVGKDYHTEEHVIGFYNTGDRMKFWGKRGAFWGGFWGMLFGSGLFLVPGVGHLMVLGPLVGWIVGALGEAAVVGGLSALGAGLYSIGIPKDSILRYETALKSDQFVVVAHGTADEVAAAKGILDRTGPISVDEHIVSQAA